MGGQSSDPCGFISRIIRTTEHTIRIRLEGTDHTNEEEYAAWKPTATANQSISNSEFWKRPPSHCFVVRGAFVRLSKRRASNYFDIDFINYDCGACQRRGQAAFRDLFDHQRGKWIRKHMPDGSVDDLLKSGKFKHVSLDIADQLIEARTFLLAYCPSAYFNQLDVLEQASEVLVRMRKCFDFRNNLLEEASSLQLCHDDLDSLAKFALNNRILYDEAFMKNPLKRAKEKKHIRVDENIWKTLELLSNHYGVSQEDCDAEYLDSLMLELMNEPKHMCLPVQFVEQRVRTKSRGIDFDQISKREEFFVRATDSQGRPFLYRKEDHVVERAAAEKLCDIMRDSSSDYEESEEEESDEELHLKEIVA
jgi:hypothetical protein